MDPVQAPWRIETFDQVREASRRKLRMQPRDDAMPKQWCKDCDGFLGRYRLLATDAGLVPFPPAIVGGPLWPANGSSVRLESFEPAEAETRYYARVQCSHCKRDERVSLANYHPPRV
jgi:hypothetical protein